MKIFTITLLAIIAFVACDISLPAGYNYNSQPQQPQQPPSLIMQILTGPVQQQAHPQTHLQQYPHPFHHQQQQHQQQQHQHQQQHQQQQQQQQQPQPQPQPQHQMQFIPMPIIPSPSQHYLPQPAQNYLPQSKQQPQQQPQQHHLHVSQPQHNYNSHMPLPMPSSFPMSQVYQNLENHSVNRPHKHHKVKSTKKPIISKNFFIHTAPEETEEEIEEEISQLEQQPRKHYNVIFLKTPSQTSKAAALNLAKALKEEKTVVYVLSKKTSAADLQDAIANAPQHINKPEVFFIKYRTAEEAANAQRQIQLQYDSLGGSSIITDEGIAPVTSVVGSLDAPEEDEIDDQQQQLLPQATVQEQHVHQQQQQQHEQQHQHQQQPQHQHQHQQNQQQQQQQPQTQAFEEHLATNVNNIANQYLPANVHRY